MPREKSAGAIIYRMENGIMYYLLLHYPSKSRPGGHWEFPKGHVEEGETDEQAMFREIKEETGISDLKIIPGFKKFIEYTFKLYKEKVSEEDKKSGKTPWVFKLVVFFVAETKTKEIKISSEHEGFLWLPIDEAIKKTTFKNSKKLLKDANDFILQTENK